jgi:hypothetical protein
VGLLTSVQREEIRQLIDRNARAKIEYERRMKAAAKPGLLKCSAVINPGRAKGTRCSKPGALVVAGSLLCHQHARLARSKRGWLKRQSELVEIFS